MLRLSLSAVVEDCEDAVLNCGEDDDLPLCEFLEDVDCVLAGLSMLALDWLALGADDGDADLLLCAIPDGCDSVLTGLPAVTLFWLALSVEGKALLL